jgi:hypothetical protein
MLRKRFEEYLNRFNAEDGTAFDDFLHPDVKILNGSLELVGVEGMKSHYSDRIWPFFKETLNLLRFIGDDSIVAVQLWTNFRARGDHSETIFGPVKQGDQFDYRGLIMYDVVDGRFSSITVAYNSFIGTTATGIVTNIGIVH